MHEVEFVTKLEDCRWLWEAVFPREYITDLWDVRDCFQRHYRRDPFFILLRDNRGIRGLLPLSWNAERGSFAYFPGETCHGRTWLEQNRVFARDAGALDLLLESCPGEYQLRYLLPEGVAGRAETTVDEIGYLFLPGQYGFDLEAYFGEFSHRSAKRIRREVSALIDRGLCFRYDAVADFDDLTRQNLARFGDRSYFADDRFRAGFSDLVHLASKRGWLRMTTILAETEPVAIDFGCLYRGTYTLLAGGTHADYAGIAKVINLHHMERACRERIERVDFLCGEFSWKTNFHLAPRPLFLLSNEQAEIGITRPASLVASAFPGISAPGGIEAAGVARSPDVE